MFNRHLIHVFHRHWPKFESDYETEVGILKAVTLVRNQVFMLRRKAAKGTERLLSSLKQA